MTCAAVGDLGNVCQRVQALEAYWRTEEEGTIRQCLADAAGLPALQASARETLRAAEDELAQLSPDGTPSTHDRWRAVQASVTQARKTLADLQDEEVMLLSYLEGELWRARTAHFRQGVLAADMLEGGRT